MLSRSCGKGSCQAAHDLGFWLHTDNPVNFLAGLQDEERWDALNPEARGRDWIIVNVHLCDLNPATHFDGKLIEGGGNSPARATPGSPHVQQDRKG
jgi:hypothetical protein